MTEKPVAQFSDQEMVEWANANLERVRELETEVKRLKVYEDAYNATVDTNAEVERLREALIRIKVYTKGNLDQLPYEIARDALAALEDKA